MRRDRLIRIPVPPTLRWKRMRLVLDNFLSQLNAQQRAGLRNIVLYNSTPPPLGVRWSDGNLLTDVPGMVSSSLEDLRRF